MNPDELGALIGRLGTRGVTSLGDVPEQLVQIGPPLFPTLLRLLEDHEYRLTLWERYGRPHEGEPINTGGFFPEHTVNPSRYDHTLRSNVIYILSRRRESQTEPLASILRQAANQAFSELSHRPDRPAPGSAQERWEAYLDACGALDLQSVRAFWAGRPDDQNDADAGLTFALSESTFGVSARLSELMEFLLARGGDIDVELHANIGHAALQYAAQDDDPERVRWLLAHGADVNRSDADGCTPLMFALRGDGRVGPRDPNVRRAVLRVLLEAGADPMFQERTQYEDFEFIGPALWTFADAEGEALLAEFGFSRPPGGGADVIT